MSRGTRAEVSGGEAASFSLSITAACQEAAGDGSGSESMVTLQGVPAEVSR